MHDLMNIHQLVAAAAAALSQAQLAQTSGRVAEVPQVRTVRFYTTHGLIDPPAAFDGRRALYATRHLLQLIAIKQLQARGMDLGAIQAHMLGADDDALRAIAALPHDALLAPPAAPAPAQEEEEDGFWRQEPAAPAAPASPEARASPPHLHDAELLSLAGVRLGESISLIIEQPARPLHPDDAAAIRAAAAPLLQVLRARKIVHE